MASEPETVYIFTTQIADTGDPGKYLVSVHDVTGTAQAIDVPIEAEDPIHAMILFWIGTREKRLFTDNSDTN